MINLMKLMFFLLLFVEATFAAKTNLETGEKCKGLDCSGKDIVVEKPAPDRDGAHTPRDTGRLCEDVADRVFDLCIASSKSKRQDCMLEYNDALDNCNNLASGNEPNKDQPVVTHMPDCNAYPYTETASSLGTVYPDSKLSNGIYRVPFENGTEVNIAHDFFKHNGPGRIDMMGRGGKPYKIVAAADGCIKHIQDSRYKAQNPKEKYRKGDCMNNFVWIKHANGEWSKYSHMQQYSTTRKAGLNVGDFVAEGTYLGDQGSVGCSFPAHLHFEIAVPTLSDPKIDTKSGGITGWTYEKAKNPFICGITDSTFQNKKNYFAVAGPGLVSPGAEEIRRHGMPYHNYQCLLQRGIQAGYQPGLIDFFSIAKDVHVNIVLKPNTRPWRSRSGMDKKGLLDIYQSFEKEGYRLIQLESYRDGNIRYAGLWEKTSGPDLKTYYGESEKKHNEYVTDYKKQGYRPRDISVVSNSGLKYTSVWEKASGSWELRSQLSFEEYRELAKANHEKGLEVVYLNSYVHKNTAYMAVIWHSDNKGKVKRRTNLNKKDFDFEWDLARKEGLNTIALSAHDVDGVGKYSAVFSD